MAMLGKLASRGHGGDVGGFACHVVGCSNDRREKTKEMEGRKAGREKAWPQLSFLARKEQQELHACHQKSMTCPVLSLSEDQRKEKEERKSDPETRAISRVEQKRNLEKVVFRFLSFLIFLFRYLLIMAGCH